MSEKTSDQIREFFGSLRFIGERFEEANLPVELLDNVKAYQEVLLSLAEEIWRERNPDRKRLPQGFRKHLSLSFSHVEDGSAVAVLKSDSSVQEGMLSDEYSINYLSLAQTRFLEITAAANENRPIVGLSTSAKNPLKQLLANVRESEGLEIRSLTGKDQKNPIVRYTEKTMKALSEATEVSKEKEIQGLGIVRAIFDSSEEIEVLSEHGAIRLPVPSAELRRGLFPLASFVEFEIVGLVAGGGQLKKVIRANRPAKVESSHEHIRFLDRLNLLSGLGNGWKDGAGKKIDSNAVRYCFDLSGFICDIYPNVSLFPEIDGSLKIEFETRGIEVSVLCKKDHIKIEVFDDSDDDPKEKAYFGLGSKLLSDLVGLEDFKS